MSEGEAQTLLRQAASHLRVAAALFAAASEEIDDASLDMFTDTEYDDIENMRGRIVKELRELTALLAKCT